MSRLTQMEGNRRFLRFPVLSPVPMIGKGFGKRFEALLARGLGDRKVSLFKENKNMNIITTSIDGVVIIEPRIFEL